MTIESLFIYKKFSRCGRLFSTFLFGSLVVTYVTYCDLFNAIYNGIFYNYPGLLLKVCLLIKTSFALLVHNHHFCLHIMTVCCNFFMLNPRLFFAIFNDHNLIFFKELYSLLFNHFLRLLARCVLMNFFFHSESTATF